MDPAAAKLIGAGLAAIGVGLAALGVGNVFGSFLDSALRNPAAADGQQGRLFIGFAAAELLDGLPLGLERAAALIQRGERERAGARDPLERLLELGGDAVQLVVVHREPA